MNCQTVTASFHKITLSRIVVVVQNIIQNKWNCKARGGGGYRARYETPQF